jgi:hypothetical protein
MQGFKRIQLQFRTDDLQFKQPCMLLETAFQAFSHTIGALPLPPFPVPSVAPGGKPLNTVHVC